MLEFLDKFEKRMEWVGAAHSIINRKGKNTEIEGHFGENELTGIIISVLLFIMEKTLEDNNECEMAHIEGFLTDLLHTYYTDNQARQQNSTDNQPREQVHYTDNQARQQNSTDSQPRQPAHYVGSLTRQQIHELADYIVKDILQNNGVEYTYAVKNYTKNNTDEVTIRLITDKVITDHNGRKIVYMLTNQGYDFLFRMREVDEEIQLTIEQLKLKEYIKRKNYSSAVRQSVELITLVRQKKKEIDNFILSIRQNIHNVEIDKYEALIKSTYSMLSEEYETMAEIQNMVYRADEKISEDFKENMEFNEKLARARREVQEIHHNIGVVITEQRDLIINRHSLTDLYMDTIRKSFEFSFEKRYDFEEQVLFPLERLSHVLEDCLTIIRPLWLPSVDRYLSVAGVYEPQIIIKDVETKDGLIIPLEEVEDHEEEERIRLNSNRQVQIVGLLLRETLHAGEITLHEILDKLKTEDPVMYEDIKTDRRVFLTAIMLYDIGSLRIKEFFDNHTKVMMTPTEEFNIEYCLAVLQEEMAGLPFIVEFTAEKMKDEIHETISYEENGMKIVENLQMSNLLFKVVL